ncbi:uncharacterized protein LOC124669509 [Lolium rigidum]|uniref:uncharacterized protein LOC124669509 n=1 Tax=Lolium rigidum TaxID=89674 RepID=UPI001F5DB673|nr:uncharacterized protein LOC124669509 [Lolium rigidum]
MAASKSSSSMSEEELACWKEDVPQFDLNSETVHRRAARSRGKPFLPCLVRVGALGEGFGSKSAALCMICDVLQQQQLRESDGGRGARGQQQHEQAAVDVGGLVLSMECWS